MTSSKSLFNYGIYINTLKRFKWGSFLYFIILFLCLPFSFLINEPTALNAEILYSSNMAIPVLLAMAVPTVVAVLCFNCVHSAKQGNFVHSLPVTRLENYISSILAGLTLMIIPVLLNAIILSIISISGNHSGLPLWSIGLWILVNLFLIIVMFSFATFTAFLTGHTAANIAINVLLHTAPLILALGTSLISEIFLFGFVESDSFIGTQLYENTPLVWMFLSSIEISDLGFRFFLETQVWVYIVLALVFYVLGYVLYKKERLRHAAMLQLSKPSDQF